MNSYNIDKGQDRVVLGVASALVDWEFREFGRPLAYSSRSTKLIVNTVTFKFKYKALPYKLSEVIIPDSLRIPMRIYTQGLIWVQDLSFGAWHLTSPACTLFLLRKWDKASPACFTELGIFNEVMFMKVLCNWRDTRSSCQTCPFSLLFGRSLVRVTW